MTLLDKVGRSEFDHVNLLMNGLKEGIVDTTRQKVEQDFQIAHEKLEAART